MLILTLKQIAYNFKMTALYNKQCNVSFLGNVLMSYCLLCIRGLLIRIKHKAEITVLAGK